MALLDMPADTVQSEVVSMLRNAGVSNGVSNQYGALWRAFFATVGQRAGIAPDALLQRYAPVIVGEAQRLAQTQAVDRLDLLLDRARSGKRATDDEVFGPGLIDYLTERGGLADLGGELTARDLDKRHVGKPFAKRTVRDDGADFEAAARAAIDAGYFTETDEAEAVSLEALLLGGIDRELGGQPVRSFRARNEQAITEREDTDALAEYVRELGLDLQTATNDEIEAAIREATEGIPRTPVSTGPVFEQGPDPRWANWPADWPRTLPDNHELLADTLAISGREALREAIIADMLANARPVEGRKPVAWVMGGGGGSGKSTVLRQLRELGAVPLADTVVHIDADEVKAKLPEFDRLRQAQDSRGAAVVHNESGFIAREVTARAAAMKADMVIDGTLSNPTTSRTLLAQLREAGYEIQLIAVSLDTGEAMRRADKRALASWRYVPPDSLSAAHVGFAENFVGYLPWVDVAVVYDNNGATPVEIAQQGLGAALEILDGAAYTRFEDKAQGVEDGRQTTVHAGADAGDIRGAASAGRSGSGRIAAPGGIAGVQGDVREAAPGRGSTRGQGSGRSGLDELFQAARGSIQLPGDGRPGPVTINLFRAHDLTTFLHESGHFFLFVMEDLALQPDAPDALRADYEAALRWLGATPGTPLTVEQHEQFARGFEAYLFEGRAPAVELEGIFSRFRSWLVSVYRTLAGLNVALNDDIRGVMDRMLASEDAIDAARVELHQRPMFEDAKAMGVTVPEFERYRAAVTKARDAATERLTARALAEHRRRRTAEAKAMQAQIEAEVTADLDADRRYRALHFLQHGKFRGEEAATRPPLKLDRDALVRMYGGPEILDRLPGSGVSGVYRRDGGVHPDAAADVLGFDSGDALVMALVNLEPRAAAIVRITDQRMREMFGDMLRDGRIEEDAIAAAHGDETLQALSAEADALNRAEGRRVPPLDTVKRAMVGATTTGHTPAE